MPVFVRPDVNMQTKVRKKAASTPKKNPFLKGTGGKEAAKYIKSAQKHNAKVHTARKQTTYKAPKYKPKAKASSSYRKPVAKKSVSTKRSGGAYGAGGRFYKNGYVDSRGNRVVNGRWVAPAKKKSSGGSAKKSYSAPKKVSAPKPSVARTASAPKPTKPKISLLAKDYEDQIFKNQLAELDAADAAFVDDNKAKVNRASREFKLNSDNVNLNRKNSLQNSAEDYAARGMMRSGAYLNNMSETSKLFDDQQARMQQNLNDDKAEFARAKADYLRGSNTQRSEARRQLADRIAVENAKRAAAASS